MDDMDITPRTKHHFDPSDRTEIQQTLFAADLSSVIEDTDYVAMEQTRNNNNNHINTMIFILRTLHMILQLIVML